MGAERALARWFSSSEIIIFNLDSDQWAVDDGDVVGVEHGGGVRRRVEEQPAAGPGQAQVLNPHHLCHPHHHQDDWWLILSNIKRILEKTTLCKIGLIYAAEEEQFYESHYITNFHHGPNFQL